MIGPTKIANIHPKSQFSASKVKNQSEGKDSQRFGQIPTDLAQIPADLAQIPADLAQIPEDWAQISAV